MTINRFTCCCYALIAITTVRLDGQSTAVPQFDVTSVKSNPGPALRSVLPPPNRGKFSTGATSLRLLMQNAFEVQNFQIFGGPDWINTQGWDVEGRASGSPNPDQIRAMLRSLLEERFDLKTHREIRDLPVFLLKSVVGRNPPKASGGDCTDLGPPPMTSDKSAQHLTGACGDIVWGATAGNMFARGKQVGVRQLANWLSMALGRTVIDQTGFQDQFDVDLEFGYDDSIAGLPAPRRSTAQTEEKPSLASTLLKQLGLTLKSDKGPVQVLVIDHVEHASAN